MKRPIFDRYHATMKTRHLADVARDAALPAARTSRIKAMNGTIR